MAQTKVVVEEVEVRSRLADLGLEKSEIKNIALKAVTARNEAVSIDPNNTPGMLAHIYGTRAIREEYLPKGWRQDDANNIPSTYSTERGVRLIYQNTDRACDESIDPKAVSGKGSASSRLVESGQRYLFEYMEQEDQDRGVGLPTWYVCVAANGDEVAVELSCPVAIDNNQFRGFSERIFIVNPGDWDGPDPRTDDDEQDEQEIDVNVTRK